MKICTLLRSIVFCMYSKYPKSKLFCSRESPQVFIKPCFQVKYHKIIKWLIVICSRQFDESDKNIISEEKRLKTVVLEHYISSANNWIEWRRFSGFSALSSSHLTWLVLGKRPGLYTMGRLVSEICHLFSLLAAFLQFHVPTYFNYYFLLNKLRYFTRLDMNEFLSSQSLHNNG